MQAFIDCHSALKTARAFPGDRCQNNTALRSASAARGKADVGYLPSRCLILTKNDFVRPPFALCKESADPVPLITISFSNCLDFPRRPKPWGEADQV